MRNQTIKVNFIIQKGKLSKEGKCPIMAQITVNREIKYLGTKQYGLSYKFRWSKVEKSCIFAVWESEKII